MNILIIGGDKISGIKTILRDAGASKIYHWDARKKASTCKKIIPQDVSCVVMLTNFLNHNAMKHFKTVSKKRDIPVLCSKSSASCVHQEYVKIMGIENCKDCYAYDECHKKG